MSHYGWKLNFCHRLQSTLKKLNFSRWKQGYLHHCCYSHLWTKGREVVKCNEGNMVSEVRGGSLDSYCLILVPHNFSGPQFSHLVNGLWWRLNKIMPPVENWRSNFRYILFFLHKSGAVIPTVTGGNKGGKWFSEWWARGGDLSFTGMKNTGLVGWHWLVLHPVIAPPHSIPSSIDTWSYPLWSPVSWPPD